MLFYSLNYIFLFFLAKIPIVPSTLKHDKINLKYAIKAFVLHFCELYLISLQVILESRNNVEELNQRYFHVKFKKVLYEIF